MSNKSAHAETVLLVNPDATTLEADKGVLERGGYAVVTASTMGEGVTRAEDHPEISLILSTLDPAPGTSAAGMVRWILYIRDIPVVFRTGRDDPSVRERTAGIPVYGFIEEGCSEAALLNSLDAALRLYRGKVRRVTRELENRLKEMGCLYDISRLVQRSPESYTLVFDEILQSLVRALQYPRIAAARILIRDHERATEGFRETEYRADMPIRDEGAEVGTVTVCYLETPPADPEHPFELEELNMLESAAEQIGLFLERRRTDTALHRSEERYRAIFDQAKDGICLVHAENGTIIECNLALAVMTGRTRSDLVGSSQAVLHPPGVASSGRIPAFQSLLNESDDDADEVIATKIITAEGREKDVEMTVNRVEYLGQVVLQSMFRDVSRLRAAEKKNRALLKEKELLLRETNHRIKNNINAIFSMLSLQSRETRSEEAKQILESAANRMRSMGLLYEKLYRSASDHSFPADAYIPALMEEIRRAIPAPDHATVTHSVDSVVLSARVLSSLGMIVYELYTNTVKHAFPDAGPVSRKGMIHVELRQDGDRTRLVYRDSGMGIPETVNPETSDGFGLRLVWMLAEQMDGTAAVDRSDGTTITVEFTTPQ